MVDLAAILAEAVARRAKEARARNTPAGLTAAPRAAVPAARPSAPAPAVASAQLARPQPAPAPPAPAQPDDIFALTAAAAERGPTASALLDALRGGTPLLTAFVLHEALGKPVALRDDGPLF